MLGALAGMSPALGATNHGITSYERTVAPWRTFCDNGTRAVSRSPRARSLGDDDRRKSPKSYTSRLDLALAHASRSIRRGKPSKSQSPHAGGTLHLGR
jgi:hypothetical protein